MATSSTKICNQALGKIGAKRINDLDDTTDTKQEAIQCRLHYEPTRDALEESYEWTFNSDRKTLAADTETPDGEWDFQFILPTDYLAMRSIYENRISAINYRSYAIEGDRLLTNESTMQIRYTKKVTDPTKFDPLFIKLFVALLANELIVPLAGGDRHLAGKIEREIDELESTVRAFHGQQTNTIGRVEHGTWNDARFNGRTTDPGRL